MPAPTALIVAEGAEAASARQAVETAGLHAVVCDVNDALSAIDRLAPSLVVVSRGGGDDGEALVSLLREGADAAPLVVLDGEGRALDGATVVDARDGAALTSAVRRLAGLDDETAEAPVEIEADAEEDWAPARARTEVLPTDAPVPVEAPADILRADDAIAGTLALALAPDAPVAPASRATWIDSMPLDEAYDDIDLDALAVAPPEVPAAPSSRIVVEVSPARAATPLASPLADTASWEAVRDAGDLADVGVGRLVGRLHRAAFTGRLSLRRDERPLADGERVPGEPADGAKDLFFDGGLIVAARSSWPGDGLGEHLWREGLLGRADLARAVALAADPQGVSLGDALVRLGRVAHADLAAATRRHVEALVHSVFAWDGGRFALSPDQAGADERVRVAHPYALVVGGVRRKLGLDRLVEKLGLPGVLVAREPALEAIAALAELAPRERTALAALDGACTVGELAAAGNLGEREACALAWAMVELGGLRTVAVAGDAPRRSGLGRERVLAKHAQLADADYFAVLGLRRDATTVEIDGAAAALRAEFSASMPDEMRRGLADKISEILDVVDEAREILRDEKRRARYRAAL